MEFKDIIIPLIMMGVFSAFIHAIVEVFKGVVLKPIKFIKEVFFTIVRGDEISEETIKSLVFGLALMYCRVFEFDAMTDILKLEIADENTFAWWLAYIGTSSVVYVGVDVFYNSIEKLRGMLANAFREPPKPKDG